MGKLQDTIQDNNMFNPFPGLRPFSTDESHLFFGREGQSQEVLDILARKKFVALLGTSGSGKSSLMYCGVIPILEGGFITEAGEKWKTITCRPGQNPINSLTDTLINEFDVDESDSQIQKDYIHSTLSASSMGLVEVLSKMPRSKDQNILLLIDQFEELFRFNHIRNDVDAFNDVLAYVKLLLEAWNNSDIPLYVVITMRSDFVGECAQFQELTRIINDSHYLIPQMTREDFRDAIVGPIAVGGGEVSPHLVQQLLNDIGERPDQLPILQHAMMRTWNAWIDSGRTNSMDIRDYENIGKLEKALSEHANEAYNELSQEQKEVCQSIFKTLTERGSDNRGVRRPTKVSEIAEISNSTSIEIIKVIDHFRLKGRSFLSPAAGVELTEESIIDISHESLMRIWDKLIVWVSEEYEAVLIYKRLSDSAEKHQLGIGGLWRQPDLQLAISWKEKQKPTLKWAQRHNPAFERTMVFLENSYNEYKLEEENKLRQQRRTLRRSRVFAIVLGSAAILSLFFMINSFILTGKAEDQTELAKQQSELAQKEKENALEQSRIAEEERSKAKEQEELALEQKELADVERKRAIFSAKEAKRQQLIADEKSKEASEQRNLAEQSLDEAKKQQQLAEAASYKAQSLRMLSISQSMAVKSIQMTIDTTLKALLAYQSYIFNKEYLGNSFNNDIYNGLYYAHKFLYGYDNTDFVGHNYPIRSIVTNDNLKVFYSTGNDGKIIKWNYNNPIDTSIIYQTNQTNRVLIESSDKSKLFVGTNVGDIIEIDLVNNEQKKLISIGKVINLMFIDGDNLIIMVNNGLIYFFNLLSGEIHNIETGVTFKNISYSKNYFFGTTANGYLAKINSFEPLKVNYYEMVFSEGGIASMLKEVDSLIVKKTAKNRISAIVHNENYKMLSLGNQEGNIIIYDINTFKQLQRLNGHTARINDLKFCSKKRILASASNDGISLLWNIDDFNLQPFVLSDNSAWVNKIEFINSGNQLLVGYADGKIRKWQTESNSLAIGVESRIKENFTKEEWNRYVGNDIEYQKTIENIPVNDE